MEMFIYLFRLETASKFSLIIEVVVAIEAYMPKPEYPSLILRTFFLTLLKGRANRV